MAATSARVGIAPFLVEQRFYSSTLLMVKETKPIELSRANQQNTCCRLDTYVLLPYSHLMT